MEGVPRDLEPDIIMKKKGKNANTRNKSKLEYGDVPKLSIDSPISKSVTTLVNKFELEANFPISRNLNDVANPEVSRTGMKLSDSSIEVRTDVS